MRNGLEVVAVVGILGVAVVVFLPAMTHSHHKHDRRANCKENLSQIGKAVYNYTQNNNESFPFSWGPAHAAPPAADGAAQAAAMAMTGIANLYPQYLATAKPFRCPCTENEPSFTVNTPVGSNAATQYVENNRNWTLRDSSYGYDPRIYPSAVSNHAIAGDMDGTWQSNRDTATQNHEGGHNILYVDGHVSWKNDNSVSNDPLDNVFAEDAWAADTDSFLITTDRGLGRSFQAYDTLHYGADGKGEVRP